MTTPARVTDNQRRRRWLLGIIPVLALVSAGCASEAHHTDSTDSAKQQPMASPAASAMPFDLNATTHTFTKDATGGIEQVVAVDPGDQRNIALIRQHLEKEAGQFTKGDYSDPAAIHGTTMPGLQ